MELGDDLLLFLSLFSIIFVFFIWLLKFFFYELKLCFSFWSFMFGFSLVFVCLDLILISNLVLLVKIWFCCLNFFVSWLMMFSLVFILCLLVCGISWDLLLMWFLLFF